MEQQIKAEQANAAAVEQYKREMLAQAQRTQIAAPAPARVTAAEHVERVLERAEPVIEAIEPIAEFAARSGLASAAAKGIEIGLEALEDHIEHKKAEHTLPAAPPAPPPPPAPAPPPVIDININQQIEQTAPAVVAPAVVAPTVVAPAAAVITAPPPVQAVPLPAPAAPMPTPVPIPSVPVPMPVPVPVPIPPAPVPVPVSVPVRPAPIPVAVPVRPAPVSTACETFTTTITCPCHRPPMRPCRPVHTHRQSCCASRRPASCRTAPCPRDCKSPRVTPQTNAWFTQPAVEAAYAAYTAALAPDDDAMPAFRMRQAVQASAAPAEMAFGAPADVAYADQTAVQDGYFELPTQDYVSLEDYLARNTARGILEPQVRVASDDGAPVPGANVDILKTIAGVTYLFYHGVTDANGSAGRVSLPAPDRSLSFAPPQGFVPYAVYTVSVTHDGYAPQVLENVTVFPGTESVQVVRLGMSEPSMVDEGRYVM